MYFGYSTRLPKGRIALFLLDAIVVLAAVVVAAMIRLGPTDGWHYVLEHMLTLSGSAAVFLLVFYAGGLYERQVIMRRGIFFRLPVIVVAIAVMIVILLFYARFKLNIGRGILMLASVIILIGLWGVRWLFRCGIGYGLFLKKALVLGDAHEAQASIELIKKAGESGYALYGVVTCSHGEPGRFVLGVPVLGGLDTIRDFVDAYDIETLIVSTSRVEEFSLLKVLRPLRYAGVEILDYVALHEDLAQAIPVDHIDDEWLMNAAMNSSRIHIRQIKRIMDLAVAGIGIIVTLPISLAVIVLIKLTSRGPVLYRQLRAGLDGRPYTLWKFRTMRADAEADGQARWSQRDDQRITVVGRFLRKWRIDEIPQLVNVLRSEMSLVGPRPERPEFIETLAQAIPFYKERLLVPPGITGWAQVKYPYAASIESSKYKLQYDLHYIKNMSFFFDLFILLRTFRTILQGLRHHKDYEADQDPEAPPLDFSPPKSGHEQTA